MQKALEVYLFNRLSSFPAGHGSRKPLKPLPAALLRARQKPPSDAEDASAAEARARQTLYRLFPFQFSPAKHTLLR
jgi:hypothetical protein